MGRLAQILFVLAFACHEPMRLAVAGMRALGRRGQWAIVGAITLVAAVLRL